MFNKNTQNNNVNASTTLMKVVMTGEVESFLIQLKIDSGKEALARNVMTKILMLRTNGSVPGYTRKLTAIEGNVWELKVDKVRIVYTIINQTIHLIVAFRKKTQWTPKNVLQCAAAYVAVA